jgi:fermentation-respiration switch protein FrsA (DUF1100 family)
VLRGGKRSLLGPIIGIGLLTAACSSSARPSTGGPATTNGNRAADTEHAVGTVTETFVDPGRAADGSTKPTGARRTLRTVVFYPAIGPVRSGAAAHVAPDVAHGPYPLIVFAHGYGSTPLEAETLVESWASAGYVVAAPAFPLSNAQAAGGPNAADYVHQPADMSYVISATFAASGISGPLQNLVDVHAPVGIAGHSLGGITTLGLAVDTCCHDDRIKAAIVMSGDALTFPGGRFDYAHAPALLFVHGTADPVVSYESSVDAFNLARGPKGLLSLPGGDHGAPVDPKGKLFANVTIATRTFFDKYLKRATGAVTDTGPGVASGAAQLVFDASPGSDTTLPTTPTTVGLTRLATASATAGLRAGQSVTVNWSHYTPGKSVNIVECSERDTLDAAACDLKHATLLHADPTGSGSLAFTIVSGPVGNGLCDAAHDTCALIVNDGGSFDRAASVRIPITFASG